MARWKKSSAKIIYWISQRRKTGFKIIVVATKPTTKKYK
jgi:hypothetical protein